jgi:DNA processing protein
MPGDRRRAACARCLRRSWLLGELSAVLDCNSRADGRLLALLALADEELIDALGGRRRSELRRRHADPRGQELTSAGGVRSICRHDPRYPRGLLHPGAPPLLHVTGGIDRLRALTTQPVAAFLASSRASDYGLELARGLGRGLGASGVTVAAGYDGGLARAALAGALEADGPTLAVAGDGLGVAAPSARRAQEERLERRGCTVAELPCGVRGRRWGPNAAERIVASLADVAIVVEAEDGPRALAAPRLARELGRTLAACPGRVSSRASGGSHVLLKEGAHLVRDAQDALDLLYGAEPRAAAPDADASGSEAHAPGGARPALSPRLGRVLEQVGAGVDTPGKLAAGSLDAAPVLRALGELEAIGLLRRGDGGRYLVCSARPWRRGTLASRAQMES